MVFGDLQLGVAHRNEIGRVGGEGRVDLVEFARVLAAEGVAGCVRGVEGGLGAARRARRLGDEGLRRHGGVGQDVAVVF